MFCIDMYKYVYVQQQQYSDLWLSAATGNKNSVWCRCEHQNSGPCGQKTNFNLLCWSYCKLVTHERRKKKTDKKYFRNIVFCGGSLSANSKTGSECCSQAAELCKYNKSRWVKTSPLWWDTFWWGRAAFERRRPLVRGGQWAPRDKLSRY